MDENEEEEKRRRKYHKNKLTERPERRGREKKKFRNNETLQRPKDFKWWVEKNGCNRVTEIMMEKRKGRKVDGEGREDEEDRWRAKRW